jgi:hypothetical protein
MRTNQMANRKGMMLGKLVAGCYRLRLSKNSTVNKRLDPFPSLREAGAGRCGYFASARGKP